MSEEKCRNCKFLGEIYTPPTMTKEAGYYHACFLFASEMRVMYLSDTESLCECFTEKEGAV